MKFDLKKIIETNYKLNVKSIEDAPRQFVAQTFIIRAETRNLFCKVVDKKLFIPSLIASLSALDNMYQLGFNKINYPIPTSSQEFYVMYDGVLIVLFNYIDAPQNYTYDNFVFGKTMAEIHNLTEKLTASLLKETFQFKHQKTFKKQMMNIISLKAKDDVVSSLKTLLSKNQNEMLKFFNNFLEIAKNCQGQEWQMVITHGDAPGNILVKSPKDFYIVDWDDMLLAPAERDLWFLVNKKEFMDGYKAIFPQFSINREAVKYYVYSRYFNDLVEYWAEIIGEFSLDHKRKNFLQMEKELFEKSGWLYPVVKKMASQRQGIS
jgi:thiamine kinase-like enzyme